MALLLKDRGAVAIMTRLEARDLIHAVPLFAGLDEDDLDELAGDCKAISLNPGETLVRSGDPSVSVFVVVDGELEVLKQTGNASIPLGVRGPGDVVGEMALLTNEPRNATLVARSAVKVLEIGQQNFAGWLERHPDATLNVLGTIVCRLQSAEGNLVQHQHLTALGTLAAGLAHELNNPASALLRTADQLNDLVNDWSQLSWDLGGQVADQQLRHSLARMLDDIPSRRGAGAPMSPLARSDREGEVASWLLGHDVEGAWRWAPVLVEGGWDIADLDTIARETPSEQLTPVIQWLARGGTVNRLLDELRMSAQVISDLVSAVKSYSRLDEAPIQIVDIHEGIDLSLVLLRYKLRDTEVVRDFAQELPTVIANPVELNQLWTNLLDNAAEAAGTRGRVIVRTRTAGAAVLVEVEDNGGGVPVEIQSRIFEPFFTTRAPGKGTGLGLAISHSIVQKHRGTIDVDSRPGRTIFRVRLPAESRE